MEALDKKTIGFKIKQFRIKKEYTQFELAERVGMHEKQISRIESGINMPTFENFLKILKELNIGIEEFGIKKESETNPIRDKIIKTLYNSVDNELLLFLSIIEFIKKNKNLLKNT